jgi:hypothetical protein
LIETLWNRLYQASHIIAFKQLIAYDMIIDVPGYKLRIAVSAVV